MRTLDQYIPTAVAPKPQQRPIDKDTLGTPDAPPEVPPSYLISIGYEGEKRSCYLSLYEPKSHRIYRWYDTTGHRPYCFSDRTIEELSTIEAVTKNPGFDKFQTVEKYDALRCQPATRTKIVARDPLTIGGKPVGSIRDAIHAWEADIKYVENYIYDNNLEPGMMYKVEGGRLGQVDFSLPRDAVAQVENGMDYRE